MRPPRRTHWSEHRSHSPLIHDGEESLMPRERLQKLLASRGVASRRSAEVLIRAGDVMVNGQTAHLGQMVDAAHDTIAVWGRPLDPHRVPRYLAFHKPTGVVTTRRATHGEPTVMDILDVEQALFPVGRLDKDTSGLLLFTNDGDWANLIAHPRYRIEKEYEVVVRGVPSRRALQRLRAGIELEGGVVTAPAAVDVIDPVLENARLSVTVIEGKKRQIRLMMAAVGHPVLHLQRVRIGPIELDGLPRSRWRNLTDEEVESIRACARRSAGGRRPP
jgi:23S rRNA pseudouridine2605 synthase